MITPHLCEAVDRADETYKNARSSVEANAAGTYRAARQKLLDHVADAMRALRYPDGTDYQDDISALAYFHAWKDLRGGLP